MQATQQHISPEVDAETVEALRRYWQATSRAVRAASLTRIGQEIAKRELEAA